MKVNIQPRILVFPSKKYSDTLSVIASATKNGTADGRLANISFATRVGCGLSADRGPSAGCGLWLNICSRSADVISCGYLGANPTERCPSRVTGSKEGRRAGSDCGATGCRGADSAYSGNP